MAEYDEKNQGTLSPVKDKKEGWHADFSGSINIEGKWFWLNAYKRDGANGEFYSVKIGTEKPPMKQAPKTEATKAATLDDFDDDLPF